MRTLLAKVTDHLTNANITLRRDDTDPEPLEMDIDPTPWDDLSRLIAQADQDPQQ